MKTQLSPYFVQARRLLLGLCLAALSAGYAPGAMAQPKPQPKQSQTLGFVITIWNIGLNETRFADECPSGMNPGYDEIWWRGLSKDKRAQLTDNGLKSRLDRYFNAIRRGENGEDVALNPTSVKPEPFLFAQGPQSYGINLDGTADGAATEKTCKHEKFLGMDGKPGVDNQLFRLLGCVYGFRSYGQYQVNANENRKSNGLGMTLIEVANVDDAQNDSDVTVTFYRSIDQYTLDGGGQFTPFSSYRIDMADGKPRYASSVKGQIVDGVLTTKSADANFPFYGNYTYMNQLIRDMQLRMPIAEGAGISNGLVAGYFDVEQIMFYLCGIGPIASSGFSDCPSTYAAAQQIADGYPDPTTGKCTALSSAFTFAAVPAFIIHPKGNSVAEQQRSSPGLVTQVKSALGLGGR